MFWKCCVQYLERVVVLEVLCAVLGACSCSGSFVHSNWSGLFCKCCAQYLDQMVLLKVLYTTLFARYILHIEGFPTVLLQAGNVQQLFFTIVCFLVMGR